MYDVYILLDYMIDLSFQFKMYVNIMLEINKTIQDGCVKSTRGAMISPEGKRRGGLWETKSFNVMCQA